MLKSILFILAVCLAMAAPLAWAGPISQGEGGPPQISFYHWRTVYDPGPTALKRLEELRVNRLYMRFFEVTLDDRGLPVPQATAVFKQKPGVEVVPVIFIENKVFSQIDVDVDVLAQKLFNRVEAMAEVNGLHLIKELHLDCDWTPSTRENFFAFAEALKKYMPPGWILAATIRLDQYKNHKITGVPPVNRVVLMAYNMGDIKKPGPGNSIINRDIAASYLKPGHNYPLPLDAALPLFSWAAAFDDADKFVGLVSPAPEEMTDPQYCRQLGRGMFEVITPFQVLSGWKMPRGWRLRFEQSEPDEVAAVAALLTKSTSGAGRVIFYHLDEDVLKNRSAEELLGLARQLITTAR